MVIQKGGDIYQQSAKDMMSKAPKTIDRNALAVDALKIMKNSSITQLIVIDSVESYVGFVHIHDIIKEGLN